MFPGPIIVRHHRTSIALRAWHDAGARDEGEPIDRSLAAHCVRAWFPQHGMSEMHSRSMMISLQEAANGQRYDWYTVYDDELLLMTQRDLADGTIVARPIRDMAPAHQFPGIFPRADGPTPSRDPAEQLAKQMEDEARAQGMQVPPPATAKTKIDDGKPYQNYVGSGASEGLPDKTDESCPNNNWRSESTKTASADVIAWFEKFDGRGDEEYNQTLGIEGGGGFLRGSTRVIEIPPGSRLVRYHGNKGRALGSWWFFRAYTGDPRVFAALPKTSSAEELVEGIVKCAAQVLCGIGAPRCTNKPGGPPQIFFPYDPKATETENVYLKLL